MEDNNIDYVLPVTQENDKKKPSVDKKKIAIIILSVIVVLVIAYAAFSFLLPKSIEGTWELVVNPDTTISTADEVAESDRVYYTFSAPGDYGDGIWKTYYNGGVEQGEYKLSEKDGKQLINLGAGDLEFTITGSKLLCCAELTITYPEIKDKTTGATQPAQDYIFSQASDPMYEEKSYDSYNKDDKLIGKWTTKDRSLEYYMYDIGYTETVEFFDNGIMTIHYECADLALDRYMYYAYTTSSDKKLVFSLVTNEEYKYTVSYTFDENSNLKFTDDNTGDSIFSDAFFSTATYYTPDNLQKETENTISATE